MRATRENAPRPPEAVPFLLLAFRRDPLAFLADLGRHGDLVRVPFPLAPLYFVYSPAIAEELLVSRHHDFVKDWWTRSLSDAIGKGLLVSEGDVWKRQRKLAQPAFHHHRVAAYAEAMVAHAERTSALWTRGGERDVHADMMRLTAEIVAETLFGAQVGGRAHDVESAIEIVMRRYLGVANSGFPLPLSIPTPTNLAFRRAVARIDELLGEFIAERRRTREDRGDLLSMLLDMDDRQLRDECLTLFVAGHETTALALAYAFRLLAEHPDTQSRLHDELQGVLGGRRPTAEDARRLPFTEAVIKESMRLYPPVWTIGREARVDTELGGCFVPKGAQVAIAQWALHRDARLFPDPESFRPERWLGAETQNLPRFAYLPFGGGPRVCIGNGFAMLEAVLLLAVLAGRHRVELSTQREVGLMPSITLRPKASDPSAGSAPKRRACRASLTSRSAADRASASATASRCSRPCSCSPCSPVATAWSSRPSAKSG